MTTGEISNEEAKIAVAVPATIDEEMDYRLSRTPQTSRRPGLDLVAYAKRNRLSEQTAYRDLRLFKTLGKVIHRYKNQRGQYIYHYHVKQPYLVNCIFSANKSPPERQKLLERMRVEGLRARKKS